MVRKCRPRSGETATASARPPTSELFRRESNPPWRGGRFSGAGLRRVDASGAHIMRVRTRDRRVDGVREIDHVSLRCVSSDDRAEGTHVRSSAGFRCQRHTVCYLPAVAGRSSHAMPGLTSKQESAVCSRSTFASDRCASMAMRRAPVIRAQTR